MNINTPAELVKAVEAADDPRADNPEYTTPEEAIEAAILGLKAVYDNKHDGEDAHMMEDALHVAVLKMIAAGHPEPGKLAAIALLSERIPFKTCYA